MAEPKEATSKEELKWVAGHEKFGMAIDKPKQGVEITPDDVRGAPSRAAVNMLRYYVRRPNEFWRMYLQTFNKGKPGPSRDLQEEDLAEAQPNAPPVEDASKTIDKLLEG